MNAVLEIDLYIFSLGGNKYAHLGEHFNLHLCLTFLGVHDFSLEQFRYK